MRYSGESGHRAEPGPIVDAIKAKLEAVGIDSSTETPKQLDWNNPEHRRMVRETFDDDGAEEAMMPAFGELGDGRNANGDCGNPHPFVCSDCGHSVEFGRTCGMSVCARCGQVWVRDAAISKAAKVRRVRKEKHHRTPANEHQKIHHIVVSPPPGWYAELGRELGRADVQEATREVVKEILEELRAQGVLVRHSFRFAADDGSLKSESDSRGLYKQILFSGRSWHGDVRDELAWKPHYHGIVVSDWIEGGELTEAVEEETGWVIHRIAGDDGVSIANDGQMAAATAYAVSHADILVREDAHNRSAVWEVGRFGDHIIKSSSAFAKRPADTAWADAAVRRIAPKVLGISSGTTDCGAELPGVDDPDELARKIIDELYPNDDRPAWRDLDTDAVLWHVSEGNISVEVSTMSGGGGDVTVLDAWGEPVGAGGWGGSIPDVPSSTVDGADEPVATLLDEDDCGCGDDHGRDDEDDVDDDRGGAGSCTGTLIPLEAARKRGLLVDQEWLVGAPFADEALDADVEWPDDLEPWKYTSPGKALGGAGGG